MSVQVDELPAALLDTGPAGDAEIGADDWDLDVTFIEAGDEVKHLIYMTNDECGTTCQSACPPTCGH